MTTVKTTEARFTENFRFPDPPPREPDDMTSFDHLTLTGSVHHLVRHFGDPDTTLIVGERYLALRPTRDLTGVRYPDLLIAFDVDPTAYYHTNAYVISEQGKPPDFLLEIASRATVHIDTGEKREDYAALGIPEYWRFDETGEYHGARLAGDRLVDGEYRPIPIERVSGGILRGHSAVLDLDIRWHDGQLEWYDSATGRHIVTFDDEREARLEAEARVRDLEAEIRRMRSS